MKITAPWSPEQVAALNKWQQLGYVHEFTCPHGHGPLTAQRDFWMCLRCGYTQEWAHDFMCDVATHPKNPLAPNPENCETWKTCDEHGCTGHCLFNTRTIGQRPREKNDP